MKWEQVIKNIDYKSSDSEQGLHVTKFYMFLKRYFADTHTKKFLEFYIPYYELDEDGKRQLFERLQSLLGDLEDLRVMDGFSDEREFPGITIKEMSQTNIELEFNDAEHIANRDAHIEESREYEQQEKRRAGKTSRGYGYWWTKDPPYDEKLQQAWHRLSEIVKRSSWYNWRRRRSRRNLSRLFD